MKTQISLIVGIAFLIMLSGCSDTTATKDVSKNADVSKNTSPASYISDVVTYSEGYEAFVCYFVLKDASGRETANSGTFTIKVEDDSRAVYSRTLSATEDSFQVATVGQGTFERERLLCYVGRITYSEFTRKPSGFSGTVSIEFKLKNGQRLYGEDTLLFD